MAVHSSWESQVALLVLTVQLEKTLVNLLNYYYFLAYLHPTRNRKTANIYPNTYTTLKGCPTFLVTSAEFSYHGTMISNPTCITWSQALNKKKHFILKSNLSFGEDRQFFLSSYSVPDTQDCKVSLKEDIKITDYVPNAFLVLKSKTLLPSFLPKDAQPL